MVIRRNRGRRFSRLHCSTGCINLSAHYGSHNTSRFSSFLSSSAAWSSRIHPKPSSSLEELSLICNNLHKMASVGVLANGHPGLPLFSFGVISDVQYADIPDGHSFSGVPRFYRHSIQVLQRAVGKWNDHKKIQFTMNFGDIVDGFCPKAKSLSAVQKVVKEFERFNGPTYHMVGNHCLYNLPRTELISLLKMPSFHGHAYYEFSPAPGYRFVVLDAYEISAIGWPRDHPNLLAAMHILRKKNPNANKNSPNGMIGLDKRFLMFNGAVGKEQLLWLDSVLWDSTKNEEKVVICSHLPLHPKAASMKALLWNYEEVLKVVHSYKCVKACLAGHDHRGGYFVDSHGIHHRVFEAALECPPGSDAFGQIDVHHDRFSLLGTDRMMSTEMVFS